MADIYDVTPEHETKWAEWYKDRPVVIQQMGQRFRPWKLYRLATSGHRVLPYSFSEDGTMTVVVLAKYNLIAFERRVFGVNPDDLTECELPIEGELVGEVMNKAEQLEYINERRAKNGLKPFTKEELHDASEDGCAMGRK